jgi:hypothetical protein
MQIDGIPVSINRLQEEIARRFDVDVITVHPHEPDSESDASPYRFMVCCEFDDGRVYMADVSSVKCTNKTYVNQWISRMRNRLGIHI